MSRHGPYSGLLGDTSARDYSRKLTLFNSYAEPELREAIAGLALEPGTRVLDAGCGTGEALRWFRDEVGANCVVVGIDLAAAHTAQARSRAPSDSLVVQANLLRPPFRESTFDLVWAVNTINHVSDVREGVKCLRGLLRPGGRLALGQSSLLPDMYFAWDARLEQVITDAVRRYYRERYQLEERDLAGIRGLVGALRGAGLHNVRARTFTIERVSPLNQRDEAYLLEAIFQGTWGARLKPYLSSDDYDELVRLCDPAHPAFALRRPDFHFLQTFTLVVGEVQ